MRILLVVLLTTFIATNAYPAALDDYYLEQFGERVGAAAQTALKASVPEIHKCGMPLRKGLRSDWNKLESTTQKVLAKYLERPVLSGTVADQKTYTSANGHFVIHYTVAGSDAPPLTTTPPNAVPDWIITVATTFEEVYATEVVTMGYAAPTTGSYDIYLQQLVTPTSAVFGLTDSDILTGRSATSYITIDNDFADTNFGPYRGLSGLQITAAHEFHHAIQFFYNYYFEPWYAEATASWMEDEVYDSVNQIYEYSRSYLQNPSVSLNSPSDGGYSRWIFNRLLAENHNPAAIRAIWEKLRITPPQGAGDIPMLPIIDTTLQTLQSSLATEFSAFAKRLYARNWTSHATDLNLLYSVPLTMAAAYTSYPVTQASVPSPTTSLAHYAMKYYRFVPTAAVSNLTLTITSTTGIQTTLFKKSAGIISEVPVNSGGNPTVYTYTVNGFGTLNPATDEVVLAVVNASATDNLAVSCSTDGSTANLSPTSDGGGGGGGCFIATAAYGSYLHPKVRLLRDFRDDYLLTTSWGRELVAAYYRLSPPLAEYIARHETLRLVARIFLTPLIFVVEYFWLTLVAVTVGSGIILVAAHRARQKKPCPVPYS